MNSVDPCELLANAVLYADEFVWWAPNVPGVAGHMRRVHEEAIGLATYAYFGRFLEKVIIM